MKSFKAYLVLPLFVLPACAQLGLGGDPMANVPTLSEVELATDAETAQLVSTNEGSETPVSDLIGELISSADSSESDPEAATDGAAVSDLQPQAAPEAPMPTGPFAWLRRNLAPPQPATPEPVAEPDVQVAGAIEGTASIDVEVAATDTPETPPASQFTQPQRAGFFSWLQPRPPANTGEVVEAAAPTTGQSQAGGLGILSGFGSSEPRPDPLAADVPALAGLEFGVVGRTCGIRRREMGSEILSSSGFKIYDTNPGSTNLRPHYITGFDDRCPRQFSAALVMLGDVGTHELVRYSRTRVTLDYSSTDTAYERIKGRFCGVGEGQPCGNRLERLGAKTTFVTAYRSFGAAPVWAEFLLHDGALAAVDLEGN